MRRLEDEVELADLHHRLVTTQQLRSKLSTDQIRRRVAQQQLYPVLPGVFCLDPPSDGFLFRASALCLRCPEGFVAGLASSRYWNMRRGISDLFEFSVPTRGRPSGIEFALLRFTDAVCEDDVFHSNGGLRVSVPARAVFECASRLDEFGLRSLIQSGLQKGVLTQESLQVVGERLCHRGRRGTRLFRRVVEIADTFAPVHSEAELMLLDSLRKAGLDDATPQYPIKLASGFTVHVDVGVPSARLAAEVDGPTHDDTIAVHGDKSRDRQAAIQGWQVVRVTADEVRTQLRTLTAQLVAISRHRAALLSRSP